LQFFGNLRHTLIAVLWELATYISGVRSQKPCNQKLEGYHLILIKKAYITAKGVCDMASLISIGLPSRSTELLGKRFFRGQTLRGRAHIVSEGEPYTAREIKILAEVKADTLEREYARDCGLLPLKTERILYLEENVEVTPAERVIDFEFPIPLTAPFSFDSGLARVEWRIILSIKSGIVPRLDSRDFEVLPHFLKSETPPPGDEVPLPACKKEGKLSVRYSSFHLWRYLGVLHRSSDVIVDFDSEDYTVGDPIRGKVTLLKDFGNGTLNLYLVFLNKGGYGNNISEEEHLILHTTGTFFQGSGFRFSCSLPLTGYPTFDSLYVKTWWILRAVVSTPFRLTKVTEKELFVRSLTF
jgi:hypothetical protein